MYPLMFEPIYKEMIWGGNRLKEKFGRDIPSDKTGESWDISCRKDEMSVVKNGSLAGKAFIDVINTDRKGYLGEDLFESDTFPLLVKVIDANENLSVQVHPNDDYAQKVENVKFGKSEMWYILDAPEEAYLILGLERIAQRSECKEAIEAGTFETLLRKVRVKKNDVVDIPAGLIHSLTAGVMVLEIQQNSDTTYRIYDYGRLGFDNKPRQLHVDKAIDVIDPENNLNTKTISATGVAKGENIITNYISNENFAIEKYQIKNSITECTDNKKFLILTCTEGECVISNNEASVTLKAADSVFIPAAMGEYTISGCCEVIKSYVPSRD